jgi:hypothetical protein
MPDGLGARTDDGASRNNNAPESGIDWVFSESSRCQRMMRNCHRDEQQIAEANARQCIARNLEESVMGSTADRIKDIGPQPQSFDIERATKKNTNYRSVAWSGRYLQVTLMSQPCATSLALTVSSSTSP